jgi:hypothetical protein
MTYTKRTEYATARARGKTRALDGYRTTGMGLGSRAVQDARTLPVRMRHGGPDSRAVPETQGQGQSELRLLEAGTGSTAGPSPVDEARESTSTEAGRNVPALEADHTALLQPERGQLPLVWRGWCTGLGRLASRCRGIYHLRRGESRSASVRETLDRPDRPIRKLRAWQYSLGGSGYAGTQPATSEQEGVACVASTWRQR